MPTQLERLQSIKAKGAPEIQRMTDAEFALFLHKTDPEYSQMPLVTFLAEKAGINPGDAMNELYRPVESYGDEAQTPFTKYFEREIKDPERGPINQRELERIMALPAEDMGKVDTLEGVGRSVLEGVSLGWGPEAVASLQTMLYGGEYKDQGMTDEEVYAMFLNMNDERRKRFEADNPVAAGLAEFGGGMLTGFGTGALTGARTLGGLMALGAGEGAIYGAGKSEGDFTDRAIGAGIGTGTGALAGAGGYYLGRLFRPTDTVADAEEAAKYLRDLGIKTQTAGQRTGSETLQSLEASYLGRAGLKTQSEASNRALTEAAFRQAGLPDAKDVKIDTLMSVNSKLADQFQEAAKKTKVPVDATLAADAARVYTDYVDGIKTFDVNVAAKKHVDQLVDKFSRGITEIDGSDYQNLRRALTKAAVNADDYNARQAINELIGQLDQKADNWITTNAPEIAGLHKRSRDQWRDFMTIIEATKQNPQSTAKGFITPDDLKIAVMKTDPDAERALMYTPPGSKEPPKENPFIRLADNAIVGMPPLRANAGDPNAVAAAQARLVTLAGLGSAQGAKMAPAMGVDPITGASLGAAAGAVGDTVLRATQGKALMNPFMQEYLANPAWLKMLETPAQAGGRVYARGGLEDVTEGYGLPETVRQYIPGQ